MMKNSAAVAELLEPWINRQMNFTVYDSIFHIILSPQGIDFMHVPATPSSSEITWSKKEKCKGGEFCIFLV